MSCSVTLTAPTSKKSSLTFTRPLGQSSLRGDVGEGLPRLHGGEESAYSAGDTKDSPLIPGWERSPRVGNGDPLQCSCLESSMERGAWWVIVHRIAKSQTRLSTHVRARTHTHMHTHTHTHTGDRKVKVKFAQSCLTLTPWSPQSMEFFRPEYWSG